MELNDILEIIQEQFVDIMKSSVEFYSKYEIILSNEQQFIKNKDKHPNSIFIVVKFLPGSFNYGQFVQPITINALAEQNKFNVCQKLLNEYVARWHYSETREVGNDLIKQTYTTPSVMSNFNEIFEGYRSLIYTSGVFLVGENSNPLEEMSWFNSKTQKFEKIPFITSTWNWESQLDPQAFYSTRGRTESKIRTGTFSVNFTIFQKDSNFCNEFLNLIVSDDEEPIDIDFILKFVWRNGKAKTLTMKCLSILGNQNIGEFPVVSLNFTR